MRRLSLFVVRSIDNQESGGFVAEAYIFFIVRSKDILRRVPTPEQV